MYVVDFEIELYLFFFLIQYHCDSKTDCDNTDGAVVDIIEPFVQLSLIRLVQFLKIERKFILFAALMIQQTLSMRCIRKFAALKVVGKLCSRE